jgi:hypothetical protein
VVFDTNVLFTELAHHLIRLEVKELIAAHSQHDDIDVKWVLPEGVVQERRYQMLAEAKKLQTSLSNYSRLVDLVIECSDEQLAGHVNRCIEREIENLGLEVHHLDPGLVDWCELQRAAWSRLPPFDPNAKREKGFRDALILETFSQLAISSPSSSIIALVCGDDLLATTVQSRLSSQSNIRVIRSSAEVGGLINTFVENVTEEHATRIKNLCWAAFFQKSDPPDEKLYWYQWKLTAVVQQTFQTMLQKEELHGAKEVSYLWAGTVLVEKRGIRWRWSTRITKVFTGSRLMHLGKELGLATPKAEGTAEQAALAPAVPDADSYSIVSVSVKLTLEVIWEVGVQSNGKLREPKFIEVRPVSSDLTIN